MSLRGSKIGQRSEASLNERVACHEVVGWNSLGGQMPNAVAERISFYRHADFSLSLFDRRAGIT